MWLDLELNFVIVGYKEAFCALEVKTTKCFLFPSSSPLSSLTLLCFPV